MPSCARSCAVAVSCWSSAPAGVRNRSAYLTSEPAACWPWPSRWVADTASRSADCIWRSWRPHRQNTMTQHSDRAHEDRWWQCDRANTTESTQQKVLRINISIPYELALTNRGTLRYLIPYLIPYLDTLRTEVSPSRKLRSPRVVFKGVLGG